MAQSARGLGRGLEALLGGLGDAKAVGEVMMIPLGRIRPNPDQPRREFSEEGMADLTRSIREQGVLQPVVVRPIRDDTYDYEIIAGERRWRACGLADLDEIPALVREADDEQSLALALIENLQREDLNPMEESAGYALLVERFGLSQEDLAVRVGKSRSAVANTLRLMQLPESIRIDLGAGRITAGHARTLLSLADEALRDLLWRRMIELGLSVRQAEDLAAHAKVHGAFPEFADATSQGDAATDAAVNAAKSDKAAPSRREAAPMDKELHALQAALEELYGVKVRVSGTPGRGRITLHYGTEEARRDIVGRMGLEDC